MFNSCHFNPLFILGYCDNILLVITALISPCVKLDKADYFSHSTHKNVLTKELKKYLIHFLNQPNKKDNRFTNYEACVFAWNILNDGYEINTTVMPDYEQLETLG